MVTSIPKLLKDKEAAEILGISCQTLAEWRWAKVPNAPKYLKIGKAVRYRLQDLEEYVNNSVVIN